MKRFAIYGLASLLLVAYSSCSSFKQMNSKRDGDDAYYSLKDAKKDRANEKRRLEQEKKEREQAEKQRELDKKTSDARSKPGSDYYEKDFDYDDYYDYEYAARLRRFNHPVGGYGYYDNYYTNSYYYNYNPYYYGTSIYNGYNFWGPSYYAYSYNPSSYWYYNNGWGWGTGISYGWGQPWGSYYDPWSPWGYSYNPYSYYGYCPYYGYNPYGYNPYGYNPYGYNGYGNNGYNNYYYNSFDGNSNYYGPRTAPNSNDGRVVGSGGPTFGERFERAVGEENNITSPTREQVNQVVGVPNTTPSHTTRDNSNVIYTNNSYTPGNTSIDTRPSTPAAPSTGTTTTRDNSGSAQRPSNVPDAPVFHNNEPSTQPRGNGNSSSTSTPTYSAPTHQREESTPRIERSNPTPTYSAPSSSGPRESHIERSSSGSSSSSSSSGSSTPRSGNSSSGSSSRPR